MKQFIYLFIAVLSVFLAIFSLTNMPLEFMADDTDDLHPIDIFIGIYFIGEFLFILLLARYKENKSRIKLFLLSKISLILLVIFHNIPESTIDGDQAFLSYWKPNYYFLGDSSSPYFEFYDGRRLLESDYSYYYYPMFFIIYYFYRLLKISLDIQYKNNIFYNLRGILLVVILELVLLYNTFFSICIRPDRERLNIYDPKLTLFIYAFVFFMVYILEKKSVFKLKGNYWICHFVNFNFAMASLVFWRGYIMNYSEKWHYHLSPFHNNTIITNPIFLYSLFNYVFVMMFMCYSLYYLLVELEIIEDKMSVDV